MKFIVQKDTKTNEDFIASVSFDEKDKSIDTIIFPAEVAGTKIETVRLKSFDVDHPVKIGFEEGITRVGGFLSNEYVIEAELPESIKEISPNAFYNCSNLKKVKFAKYGCLTTIGEYAFSYTNNLEEIEIPASVKTISKMAFAYSGIKKITFENRCSNLSKVEQNAFAFMGHLEYAELPSTISDIALMNSLYRDDISLETFRFVGNNVKAIPESMFHNCSALTMVSNIPKKLKVIDKNAFIFCKSLNSLDLSHTSVKIIKTAAFADSGLTTITLPETLESINQEAFRESELNEITLPNSLKYIGSHAFASAGLTAINNIEVLTEVYLGDECFSNNKFKTLFLPPLNNACEKLFSNNLSLESVEISPNANTISLGLFMRCERLKKVTLPESIKIVEENAFFGCYSLEDINLENAIYVGEQAFAFSVLKKFHNHNPSLVVLDRAFMKSDITDFSVSPYAKISGVEFPPEAWQSYMEKRIF